MTNAIAIAPKLEVPVQSQNTAHTTDNSDTPKFAETLKNAKESEQKTENKPVDTKESDPQKDQTKDTAEAITTDTSDQNKDPNKDSNKEPSVEAQVQMAAAVLAVISAPVVLKTEDPKISTETVIPASVNLTQASSQDTGVAVEAKATNVSEVPVITENSITKADAIPQVGVTSTNPSQTVSEPELGKAAVKDTAKIDAQTTQPKTQPLEQNSSAVTVQPIVQEAVSTAQAKTTIEATASKTPIKPTGETKQTVQSQQVGDTTAQPVQLTEQPTEQPKQESAFSNHKKNAESKADTKTIDKANTIQVDSLLSLADMSANAMRAKQSVGITTEPAVGTVETLPKVDVAIKTPTIDQQVVNPVVVTADTSTVTTTKVAPTEKPLLSQSTEIPKKIIDQVVREISLTKTTDRNDLVVKLTPPSLGTLRLQITQDASGMTTQIVASSQQVKDLLNQHMPTLVTAMADAGIKMDSLTVTTDNKFESGTFADNKGFNQAQGQSTGSRQKKNKAYQQYTGGAPILTASGLVQTHESAAFTWYA
jgi:flagellar hook-length control protein FliK